MKISALLDSLSRPRKLWGVIFLYTLASGLFVQLILLPHFAPSWHAGHGLIKGVDGGRFHHHAITVAEEISTEGWDSWQPFSGGLFVSNIAALFYTLIYPEPWSVLPLNGVLNAFAGVAFYMLLSFFITDKRKTLIATLPFIFFPSALLWNTQFHNENYVIPGVIFILLAWTMISTRHLHTLQPTYQQLGIPLFLVTLGSAMIVPTRDEILYFLTAACILITILLSLYWFTQALKSSSTMRYFGSTAFVSWLACILMLGALGAADKLPDFEETQNSASPTSTSTPQPARQLKWEESSWLPQVLDGQLKDVSKKRVRFLRIAGDSGSAIDVDVSFEDAGDVLSYLPRALHIGILAPFPTMWFEPGQKAAGTAMRLVSALEMLFSYFCLLGLPIFTWRHRRNPALLALLALCFSAVMIYALTTSNVGALYRFRYPHFMPLVCLGLAGWLTRKDSAISNSPQ